MDKAKAESIAKDLIKTHLGRGFWKFEWSHTHNRNRGMCYYSERRITFNATYIDIAEEEEFRQTILHEIAHALVGVGYGHGPVWKRAARRIGVRNPKATSKFNADRYEVAKSANATWVMVHGLDIINYYMRRPRRSTFMSLPETWIKGRKETKGELELISMFQYENRMACEKDD